MSATTFHEEPQVLDSLVRFDEDRTSGELIIARSQELPDDWLSEVRKQKVDSANHRTGDFYKVAEIPIAVVERLAQHPYNHDVFTAPVRDTLKLLDRLALDDFITTTKRI